MRNGMGSSSARVELRVAETEADFEAWARVKRAVEPNERAWSPQEFRERARPERLVLVAELDGDVVGAGLTDLSDLAGRASVVPRVAPHARRRGVGTALLRELVAHASTLGRELLSASVDDEGSKAFAERFGFREVDRQVEQVKVLGEEPVPPPLPDGVEAVTIAQRRELLEAAHPLAVQGFADMALDGHATISLEDWLADEATYPDGSFVAMAGGEIVGYSGLCKLHEGVAEDGLTVVRRDWRRRGLATALKRRELAWAAQNGIREIVTWTQVGNDGMRRANELLGFEYRSVSITMVAPLPVVVE
jgi:GNAT superfamily N-acetyltransferase